MLLYASSGTHNGDSESQIPKLLGSYSIIPCVKLLEVRHMQCSRSHRMMIIRSGRLFLLIFICLSSILRGNPFSWGFAWPFLFGRSMRQLPTNELSPAPTLIGAFILTEAHLTTESGHYKLKSSCLHRTELQSSVRSLAIYRVL
jgi:hypothetical protein